MSLKQEISQALNLYQNEKVEQGKLLTEERKRNISIIKQMIEDIESDILFALKLQEYEKQIRKVRGFYYIFKPPRLLKLMKHVRLKYAEKKVTTQLREQVKLGEQALKDQQAIHNRLFREREQQYSQSCKELMAQIYEQKKAIVELKKALNETVSRLSPQVTHNRRNPGTLVKVLPTHPHTRRR